MVTKEKKIYPRLQLTKSTLKIQWPTKSIDSLKRYDRFLKPVNISGTEWEPRCQTYCEPTLIWSVKLEYSNGFLRPLLQNEFSQLLNYLRFCRCGSTVGNWEKLYRWHPIYFQWEEGPSLTDTNPIDRWRDNRGFWILPISRTKSSVPPLLFLRRGGVRSGPVGSGPPLWMRRTLVGVPRPEGPGSSPTNSKKPFSLGFRPTVRMILPRKLKNLLIR